jgi:hypothetical protein
VIYILDHDIHHSNYFFGKNLQLDVVVVVAELGHMHMMVVEEQVVLVGHIVVGGHILNHKLVVVVVVEVVVVVVGFLRMQQLNSCDHMLEFQNHRRDLEDIEDGLLWKLNKKSNVIDNPDHDIHHSNYFFGKNLQLDVMVVVVELGHMHMMVVEEQVVLVEHILVVVQGHMFVGVVELVVVVGELEHMFVVVHNGVVVLEVVVVGFHILGKFEFQFLVHILRF